MPGHWWSKRALLVVALQAGQLAPAGVDVAALPMSVDDKNRAQIAGETYRSATRLSRSDNCRDGSERAGWREMEAARNLAKPPVAANIRLARQLAGISQRALAEQLGIPQANLSHYERGRRKPTWERLVEVARHTGIADPGWFYSDHADLLGTLDAGDES